LEANDGQKLNFSQTKEDELKNKQQLQTRKKKRSYEKTSENRGRLTCPLLRVGQMRDGVAVGGDEHAAGVLPQAQRGILQLVVIKIAVEADDDGAHVVVVLHHDAWGQVDRLLAILLHKCFVCEIVGEIIGIEK
jgi:hypothetical protein